LKLKPSIIIFTNGNKGILQYILSYKSTPTPLDCKKGTRKDAK
jgi:hypothetical protein